MSSKTVIVDIRVGDRIDRQTYAADSWQPTPQGSLAILRSVRDRDDVADGGHVDESVALYAPGEWVSARTGDAIAPDATVRRLGIARAGLNEILDTIAEVPPELLGGEDATRTGRALAAVRDIARDALSASEGEL